MKLSDLYKINIDDAGKAAIVTGIFTILGSAGKAVIEIVQTGHFPTLQQFTNIAGVAILAGLSYIVKNFLTPAPKAVEIDPEKTKIVDTHTKEVIPTNSVVTEQQTVIPDLVVPNKPSVEDLSKQVAELKDLFLLYTKPKQTVKEETIPTIEPITSFPTE